MKTTRRAVPGTGSKPERRCRVPGTGKTRKAVPGTGKTRKAVPVPGTSVIWCRGWIDGMLTPDNLKPEQQMRMIARAGLLMSIVAAPSISHAQKAAPPSATQKAVFALEEEWTRALVKTDTMAFKRLTAPGFVYTEDNVVMTRSELIHAVATGDKVDWAGNEVMKLYDYTPTAVVTGILVVKGHDKKGKKYTNRYRFTDTWLYRGGKWQAIAAQDYLIPK